MFEAAKTCRDLTVIATAAALISACGTSAGPAAQSDAPADNGSAAGFTSQLSGAVEVDYNPLASPEAARAVADLVVTGTVTEILEGVTFDHEDFHEESYQLSNAMSLEELQQIGQYITIAVEIDEVIAGTAPESEIVYIRQRIYTVDDSPTVLPDNGIGLRAIAVAVDVTDWQPYLDLENVETVKPTGLPDSAPIYSAMPDGFWFEGPTDDTMAGILIAPQDISASWGADVDTIDEYADAIRQAA